MALGALAHAAHQDERMTMLKDFKPPRWYHGKDGPIFDVLQTSDDVELRRYYPNKWAATNITGKSFDDAFKDGTKVLDDYWGGENQPKAQLADTVPTITLIYPTGTDRAISTTFTLEYMLPHEVMDAAPAPTAPAVSIVNVEQYDVWVKVFGGYVGEQELLDQTFGFIADLQQRGVDVDSSVTALAIYDDPIRVVGRHNEVWVWPKVAPSATAAASGAASAGPSLEDIRAARVKVQHGMEQVRQQAAHKSDNIVQRMKDKLAAFFGGN